MATFFADDIFRCIFVNEAFCILVIISLKFILMGATDNNSALVYIMVWRRIGDKPLSEPMMTRFTDTYVALRGDELVRESTLCRSIYRHTFLMYMAGMRIVDAWLQEWDVKTLQWRHNERNDVSNHQPHDSLLNRLFRHRSKKTTKFRFTGICQGNSPVTDEFPTQRASNADNVSIWWCHHANYASWYRSWLYESRPAYSMAKCEFKDIISRRHPTWVSLTS